ncbi:MAG: hypothetical protein E7368_05340, partial [Clostridiales bacterium]|nr:hypothetical protein [Clostridiales bacterium]
MKRIDRKYQSIPFWAWNEEMDEARLLEQIEWMDANGMGGFFMHARSGLKTEYLGEKWFDCVEACAKKAQELGMQAYAYDENGWPSGFVGGKLLEDIENHDRYLTYNVGDYDENALVSYTMDGEELLRVNAKITNRAIQYLNVYEHYSTSTADILNPQVVDKFIALTHEEYRKRDKYGLKGFFTDEPQYFRWGTPYTKMLAPYFKEKYGEDLLDGLGLLFVEKNGYRAFRYKFWKAMQSLLLNNYSKKIYDWCDENGYQLTGHYIEETSLATQMWCCGGIMPFYEYEHIPGIDYLGRNITSELAGKQVSSVAMQLGKKQVLTETYACCGWDVTPQELKLIAESQYVSGVNLMCQHYIPYSDYGERKRDYPAHYFKGNPWVNKNFKQFNDYFSVLGELLAESKELVNVGILHPIRSAYFDYKRFPETDYFGVEDIEIPFMELIEDFSQRQIPHHYIDETILEKYGRVEDSTLVVGKCAYKYVVLPKMYTMDKTTEKLLHEFVNAGGKVLLWEEKPQYLEGEPYEYEYLQSNTTIDEIIANQPYSIQGKSSVRGTVRENSEGKKFIYAVNLGEATTLSFVLKDGQGFQDYNVLEDTYTALPTVVAFGKGESKLLYISEELYQEKPKKKALKLSETFEVCENVPNYLTLDFARYSLDGITYSDKLHHLGIFNELLKKRHAGKLYLKYEFEIDVLPTDCTFLAEDLNTIGVSVNGINVEPCGESVVEKKLLTYPVSHALQVGHNYIIIESDYYQSERVYETLFGENVTEGLKNCLAFDSNVEAVYLKGDFGVYGDFKQGNKDDVLLGNNFRIGAQKKRLSCLITEGFPFFTGDIVLRQIVELEDTDYALLINKRFHLIKVDVNGN